MTEFIARHSETTPERVVTTGAYGRCVDSTFEVNGTGPGSDS
jgi:hypothetical protein